MIEQVNAKAIEMVVGGCVSEPGEPDPNTGIQIKITAVTDICKEVSTGPLIVE